MRHRQLQERRAGQRHHLQTRQQNRQRRDRDQHPWRQQPRHAAAGFGAGVDPYLKDGVRWLNPAAFATPQPGTFGNLPRNFLRGPSFTQADLVVSKDIRLGGSQSLQLRLEMFNIANRLNYENPAANLPDGTAGVPFTDALAGTFG